MSQNDTSGLEYNWNCVPAPAPTATSLTPTSGPTAGATSVTVAGSNFVTSNTSVTIGSNVIAAANVTVTSATSLTFSTPANVAGNVAVTVTTPAGTSGTVPGGYTYLAAPTVAVSVGTSPITVGGTSTVSWSLTNSNATTLTGVSLSSLALPTNVTVAASPNVTNGCGGSVNANSGASSVSFFGGTLNSASTCTVSVNLTSSTPGNYSIPTGTPAATGPTALNGSPGTSQSLQVNPGSPAQLTIQAGSNQSATVNAAFGTALAVKVLDANNNPVPNITVTFTPPGAGASGTFSGGNTAVTNAAGIATANTFTANGTAGTNYNVTATATGGTNPSTNFTLTNTPGVVSQIAVNGGGGQSATVGTAFTTALSAVVRDAGGNPVSGVTVTFAAPGAGASGTFSGGNTAVTNGSGIATANTFTANGAAGNYNVTASAPNVNTPAIFALTNNAGAASQIAVNGGGGQSATIGTAFVTALSAVVRDAGGNPVSGVTVTFTPPGAGASGTFSGGNTAVTNGSGIATANPFTANGTVGNYNVAASAPNVNTPANFALTNTVTGPSVTTNPTSQTVASGGTATFTAAASGNPTPTVQWQVSTNGGNSYGNISGATGTTLSVTAQSSDNGSLYRAVFTNAGGTARTTSATLTVIAAPTVTAISPNNGPTTGGTSVTITGTNFTGATAVKFGASNATAFTVNSATSITATSPTGTGTLDVTVTTASGTSAIVAGDQFTYIGAPTVTAITPNSGAAAGGTSVTITGTNLTGATSVTIGGSAATNVVVASATSITAITPPHAAGLVDVVVTTPGGSATGSGLYTYAVAASTTALTSSKNPSEVGQAVTFTATVSSSAGTPGGSVTFSDGGTVIGTATLSGGTATLTTSSLTLGSHNITASYIGNSGFAGSTSPALLQAVSAPQDSLNLRAMQIAATKVIAQTSGSSITSAIDTAISEGFSGGGSFVTPSGSGMRFNFSADADSVDQASGPTVQNTVNDQRLAMNASGESGRARASGKPGTDDAFAAIDRNAPITKAPPRRSIEPPDWLFWAEVRGAGIGRWGSTTALSPLYGSQINALLGLTRRVTPNFVIGAVGGYETFDYRSDTLNGRLKGDGWTVGSYLGWRFAEGLRFDAAAAYSGIGYDGSSGAANGSFSGHRWLVSGGLTGNTKLYGFDIEPSAKIYALWENENAYTDSLGTAQADRTFFAGRASAGVKLAYPWLYSATLAISPFAGLYADYYFSSDNAAVAALAGAVPLASTALLDGWSARATGGVAARFENGAALTFGAELGGIGSHVQVWTYKGRASLPFSAR